MATDYLSLATGNPYGTTSPPKSITPASGTGLYTPSPVVAPVPQKSIGANTMNSQAQPAPLNSVYQDMYNQLEVIKQKALAIQAAGNAQVATPTAPLSLEQQQANAQQQNDQLFKDYLGALTPPENPTETYNQLYSQSGIEAQQAKVNEGTNRINALTAQLQGLNALQTQTELQTAKEGISQQGLSARNITLQRNNAIAALPIQAQIFAEQAALTGNTALLEQAQQKLSQTFEIQTQYNKALNDFNNKKIEAVYSYADKRQQAALDALKVRQQQEFQVKQDRVNNAQAVANSIFPYDSATAAKIAQIDWGSSTAQTEFANLLSKAKENPVVALDIAVKQAQLAQTKAQTSKIYADIAQIGQPTKAEILEMEKIKAQAGADIAEAKQKLTLIGDIKNNPALPVRVGPAQSRGGSIIGTYLSGPKGIYQELSGQGTVFAGYVHQLANQEFIDKLISAKAAGATFGALNEQEASALKESATAINGWEVKKNGVPTGYWDVPEATFKKELTRLETLAKTAVAKATGTVFNEEEDALLDNLPINQSPGSYFPK